MREYLSLGSTPSGEDCAQVGTRDYEKRARRECKKYIDQLIRQLGKPPLGANFAIKTFPHDFGSYYEAVIWYTVGDPVEEGYAFLVEGGLPESWDTISSANKEEMESKGARKDKEVEWSGDPGVCDICQKDFKGKFVDGRTQMGPWAKMCTLCYAEYGIGLGTGKGQRYRERPDARWLKVEG